MRRNDHRGQSKNVEEFIRRNADPTAMKEFDPRFLNFRHFFSRFRSRFDSSSSNLEHKPY